MLKKYLTISVCLALGLVFSVNADGPDDKAPSIKRTILERTDILETNLELALGTVEILKSAQIKPHTHSDLCIGQVLKGDYWIQFKDQPRKVNHPGETWIIPRDAVHEEGAVSKYRKLTGVYIIEKGKQMVNPAL
jgi:quercetin dioxygenase-like cupin family protein